MPHARPPRLWIVDTMRGVAIVAMVFFHLMWDLNFFGVYGGNMMAPAWQIFARSIASTFIFTMGVSLTLSYNRLKARKAAGALWPKYILRGVKIFGWGLLISGATYLAFGDGFVVFGILHLLGLTIIVVYPFVRFRWTSLLTGLLFIGLGFYLNRLVVPWPWLLWLGINQAGRYMVDYYPMLPWSGMALLGIFVGHTLFPGGQSRVQWPDWSQVAVVRGLTYLGRQSLLIYLLHQPILIALLVLTGIGRLNF